MREFVEATWVLEGEQRERDLLEAGERLADLAHRGCRWVVLDFFEVPHVDYKGVAALVKQAETFRQNGGGVVLTGLTPYLAKILQVGGARPEHFDCYARIEDAWEALTLAERRLEVARDEAVAARAEAIADEAEATAKAKVIAALSRTNAAPATARGTASRAAAAKRTAASGTSAKESSAPASGSGLPTATARAKARATGGSGSAEADSTQVTAPALKLVRGRKAS